MVRFERHVFIKCDNSSCTTPEITYVEERPNSIPKSFWRFLEIERPADENGPARQGQPLKKLYCSKTCLLDALRSYQTGLGPEEAQEKRLQAAKEVEAQHTAKAVENFASEGNLPQVNS